MVKPNFRTKSNRDEGKRGRLRPIGASRPKVSQDANRVVSRGTAGQCEQPASEAERNGGRGLRGHG